MIGTNTTPDWTVIGCKNDIAAGESLVVTVRGHQIAVFNVAGEYFAIDDHCPHRGASLAEGSVSDSIVRCPWHKWEFDLTTGRCQGQAGNWVRRYDIKVDGETLLLDAATIDDASQKWDGIYRYLIRYGSMGWIGRFGSIEPIACRRNDQVLIQSDRGTELGEVLSAPDCGQGIPAEEDQQQPTGELLRVVTSDDLSQLSECRQRAPKILETARQASSSMGERIELVDCELLFDRQTAVLYYFGDSPETSGLLRERLTETCGVNVLLQPVIEPEIEGGGCGQPGCGNNGCGM